MSDLPQESLLARTARGAGWVVAWRLATRMLGLCSTLVLVRLLSPEDFGLVALAAAFVLTLDVCLTIGVEDQIVRAKDPSPALYETAFTFNLLRGLLVAVLLVLTAAPAAAFFGDERLTSIFYALAVSAAASGATSIGIVDFRRKLQFEKEFQLQLLPRLAGIAVTLLGAFLLRSHWALVLGILTSRLGVVAMSHLLHPWRPRLSLVAWRDLAGVSGWSWAIGLAAVLRDRVDSLAIGRLLGPARLGVYAVGVEVAILPTSEIVDPICRACMPGFAATLRGGDMAALCDAYLRIVALVALLTLPAGIGISLIAGPVVALAFGPLWADAAPIITILGVAYTVTLFGNVSAALLHARAMLRSILALTVGAAVLRMVLLGALIPPFGLAGAGLAIGIALVVEHAVLVTIALRLLRLSAIRFIASVMRPAMATAIMAAALWLPGLAWGPLSGSAGEAARMLAVAVPLGMLVYTGALAALWYLGGRPAGAEADMLNLLRRVALRIMPRPWRGAPTRGT